MAYTLTESAGKDGWIQTVCYGLTEWNFQNWSILNTVFYQKRSNDEIAGQLLRTLNELIWPQIIMNLNSWPKSESKHMYTVTKWTKQPDLTLFFFSLTQVWPLMTLYSLIWPQVILNFNPRHNSESKDIYEVWPLMTFKRPWYPEMRSLFKISNLLRYIIDRICHQNWFARWRSRAISRFSFILLSSSTTWSPH